MDQDNQDNQAGWEWAQDDEQRWLADVERDVSNALVSTMTEQMLADFDSIFINEGE